MCQILNVKPSLLKRAIDKMFRFGKININGDGCFTVTEWKHYQGDYVRMQESRERNKGDTKDTVTNVTRNVAGGTEQTRPEEEEEADQTRGGENPAAPSIDSQFAELVQVFEQKAGQIITPFNSDRLDALRETYTTEWVGDAIIEAVEATGRWPGWKYVEAILKRWESDGRGDKPGTLSAIVPQPTEESEDVRRRRLATIEKAKHDGIDYAEVWNGLLAHLQTQVTKSNYETYIEGTSLLGIDGNLFLVAVPSMTHKKYLDERLKGLFCKGLREHLGVAEPKVEFCVEEL